MAINYDDALNARMSRIVRNYNRRVEGTKVPKVSVARLRKDYSRRADLNRELKNLEAFSKKAAFRDATAKISEYDKQLIKNNRDATIKYLEEKLGYLQRHSKTGYPLEKGEMKNVELNIRILKQDISSASQDDLRAMVAEVNDYRRSFAEQGAGYRGFLSEVEFVMGNVGIPQDQRDAFFEKLKQLNPHEFLQLYENSDLIERVYDLADSPTVGGTKLNTTVDDAREKLETLMEEIDDLIAEVKES